MGKSLCEFEGNREYRLNHKNLVRKPFRLKECIIYLSIFLYRILLDFAYVLCINKVFNYMGFVDQINHYKWIESYLYLAILVSLTKKNKEKITTCFLHIQLALMVIPMLSLYALSNQSRIFMVTICMAYLIQVFIFKIDIHVKGLNIKKASKWVKGSIIGIALFTIVYSLLLNGIPSLEAFNLDNIYEVRSTSSISFPLNYFVPWVTKIIIPFLMIYSIHNRKYFILFIFIGMQLILFMIYAHKSYLFIIPAIFGVYYIHRKGKFIKCLYMLLTLGTMLSTLFYIINDNFIYPISLFVRRLLFVPALLKFRYYDFFSTNPKVYMADGRIGNIFNIQSPYNQPIPFTIGLYYEGRYFSANTGYWGDAYANLGIVGVILFSIIVAVLIRMIEKYTNNIDKSLALAASIFSILSLNDTALLTNLLTGGMIVLIAVLYFYSVDAKDVT